MLSLHSPWVAGMRWTAQWPTHGAIPEEGLSRGCWWSPCCHWMFYWVPGQSGDVKLCSLPNLPSACTKPVTENGRTAKENLLHDIYCNAWRCFPATDVGCKALLYILEATVQVLREEFFLCLFFSRRIRGILSEKTIRTTSAPFLPVTKESETGEMSAFHLGKRKDENGAWVGLRWAYGYWVVASASKYISNCNELTLLSAFIYISYLKDAGQLNQEM